MNLTRQARSLAKRLLLGPINLPQQCILGLDDPQSEIVVSLHGAGAPLDVTQNHLMACGSPFTICIGFNSEQHQLVRPSRHLRLKFHTRTNVNQLLGEIGLRYASGFRVATRHLCLFHVESYRNYCLPRVQMWGNYWRFARQPRSVKDSDVPITSRETRAMMVFYTCPRPTVLVSVSDGQHQNMFPMNLMGPVGDGYFAFALNRNRSSAPLVQRAGKLILSSVPLEQSPLVLPMGANHRKTSIDWNQVPFATTMAPTFRLPVPKFALRVREMQVEAVHAPGSHTLFVARTVNDERWAQGLQFFVAHGIYQAWRQRHLARDGN